MIASPKRLSLSTSTRSTLKADATTVGYAEKLATQAKSCVRMPASDSIVKRLSQFALRKGSLGSSESSSLSSASKHMAEGSCRCACSYPRYERLSSSRRWYSSCVEHNSSTHCSARYTSSMPWRLCSRNTSTRSTVTGSVAGTSV